MILFFLLLLLIIPYLLLPLAGRWLPGGVVAAPIRFRVGVSLLFAFTAIAHFVQTAAMAEMLPPFVPFRMKIIYATGVLELLGALGVWIPGLERLTGLALILMLVAILPSNFYAAFNQVEFGGQGELGPLYLLVRAPFQFLLMWWIYKAAVEKQFILRTQPVY